MYQMPICFCSSSRFVGKVVGVQRRSLLTLSWPTIVDSLLATHSLFQLIFALDLILRTFPWTTLVQRVCLIAFARYCSINFYNPEVAVSGGLLTRITIGFVLRGCRFFLLVGKKVVSPHQDHEVNNRKSVAVYCIWGKISFFANSLLLKILALAV